MTHDRRIHDMYSGIEGLPQGNIRSKKRYGHSSHPLTDYIMECLYVESAMRAFINGDPVDAELWKGRIADVMDAAVVQPESIEVRNRVRDLISAFDNRDKSRNGGITRDPTPVYVHDNARVDGDGVIEGDKPVQTTAQPIDIAITTNGLNIAAITGALSPGSCYNREGWSMRRSHNGRLMIDLYPTHLKEILGISDSMTKGPDEPRGSNRTARRLKFSPDEELFTLYLADGERVTLTPEFMIAALNTAGFSSHRAQKKGPYSPTMHYQDGQADVAENLLSSIDGLLQNKGQELSEETINELNDFKAHIKDQYGELLPDENETGEDTARTTDLRPEDIARINDLLADRETLIQRYRALQGDEILADLVVNGVVFSGTDSNDLGTQLRLLAQSALKTEFNILVAEATRALGFSVVGNKAHGLEFYRK